MTRRLLRGRLLWFERAPRSAEDHAAYRYIEDGALLIEDGRILEAAEFSSLSEAAEGLEVRDHRPHLLTAGFIDTHIHFPQAQVIASYGAQLLEWLNKYTFPAELKFEDPGHAARIAERFLDELLRHGTTTAVAYCSVHRQSVDAFFSAAQRRNLRMLGGKVMMDRNAPPGLCDTAQSGYDDSKALIAAWSGQGRLDYVITPRFAITSTPEQLEAAGALMREHPELRLQTHLSENHDEIAYTLELYPEAPDYLGVYERYGLLSERSLFGHCIHLSDSERRRMAETGSVAVFCPTSNLFIGSGLFDAAAMTAAGVRQALATDVGGGDNYSMLRTASEAYKILQLQKQKLDPLSAFHQMTRGNAEALGLADRIGDLSPGSEADVIALDARATPAMALRMETVETLAEELFVLQTLGDDRAVSAVYVAGEPVDLSN